ncbi:MAG: PilZ domain-containing protein [Deltaproteobacteria bacterium]|jgi:hypothetical protein|nr:PilZ domain-containing protein [Deltaproteobacteria bacterium]
MDPGLENRDDFRYKHKAKILLENCATGACYHAKMQNYSRCGLYCESDYAPLPGTDIYISIENSPYGFGADLYRAQVRWRTKLSDKKSKYSYGVGVRYNQPQRI